TDETPLERSGHQHGRRDAPGYTVPQNTSPPFAQPHQASKWRTFIPQRRSDHPTASVVQFRSKILTSAALFLAGDDAGWITGQVIGVDGGAT
ncbi:MAG: hypothetical protein ACR2RA_17420, partial [Geminicoccaceae bacterium]